MMSQLILTSVQKKKTTQQYLEKKLFKLYTKLMWRIKI